MRAPPWILLYRHLLHHKLRSTMTSAAVLMAIFLFCMLTTFVDALQKSVAEAAANRLLVMSAVSLYVDLPINYQAKIANVPGAKKITKFQWFGGYYREPANQFAQFAVDPEVYFDLFGADFRIVDAPDTGSDPTRAALADLLADRRGAIVGRTVAEKYGWRVGDTIPLIPTIFHRDDGGAWDFRISGIFESVRANFDENQMLFRFDYLYETLKASELGPPNVGTYMFEVAPGAETSAVSAAVDALFANGPQATRTYTEAAFQAGMISMLGNVPRFIGFIGGAVVCAVIFTVINTMLLTARRRIRESGILKALGFTSAQVAGLLLAESILICLVGGILGCGAALWIAPLGRKSVAVLSGLIIDAKTLVLGIGMALAIGVIGGLMPAVLMARLKPVEALRSEG
ncbi:MAG: ABC transporter permease [Planctomycetota bacterium]